MISAVSAPIIQHSKPSVPPADKSPALNAQGELSKEEKAQVEKLKKIDREVRAHEQAHKNAGGQFAGAASFGYQVGPDGRRYAVSGEVPIDISPVADDPKATIAKMNAVAAAALAPAEPSGQDVKVAARAAAIRAKAQAELASKSQEKLSGKGEDESSNSNPLTQSAQSALVAYNAGNSQKASGNILNFFS